MTKDVYIYLYLELGYKYILFISRLRLNDDVKRQFCDTATAELGKCKHIETETGENDMQEKDSDN